MLTRSAMQSIFDPLMDSATPRQPLHRVGRPGRIRRPGVAAWLGAIALLWAGIAAGESLPGPPLQSSASQPGAYCLPRTESAGLGAAGFATAVGAIAIIARRRRDVA